MSTLTFDSISAAPRRKATRRPPALPVALTAPATFAVKRRPQAGTIALVAAIVALHGVAVVSLSGAKHAGAPAPVPVPITISMAAPPEVIPPPPPPPKIAAPAPRLKAAPPVPAAAPRPSAAPVVASDVPLVAATPETVQVAHAPVAAAPAPAPAEEPVTEPRGYAGYLHNPAPDYPPAAQKRGLEGQVVLKVHVLASGQPDSVAVAKSSGHQILDEAALKAVMRWAFAPARRGQTAIDGWVQVPLSFKI